jgi:hypothetical protein
VWVGAGDLRPGADQYGTAGTSSEIVDVHNYLGTRDMYDLTVADTHTYYVVAGTVPVLVHNCGEQTFYHGTDPGSAIDLLNGSPLDAATAVAKHTDGPGGFFMATHFDDAAFFATRNGPGAVLKVTLSGDAMKALRAAGSSIRPIPRGPKSPIFDGKEFHVPTGAFDVFNEFRRAGGITFRPG